MIPFSEVVGSRSVPNLPGLSALWELSSMKCRHLSFPQKTPTYFVTMRVLPPHSFRHSTSSTSAWGRQRTLVESKAKPGPATTRLVPVKKLLRYVPTRLQVLCGNIRSVLQCATDGFSISILGVADRHVIFGSPTPSEVGLQFERCPLQFRGSIWCVTRPVGHCCFSFCSLRPQWTRLRQHAQEN
jgi:hypothetical protein